MELLGAKRCFAFLKNAGLKIHSFISDRHRSIAKWIRESEPQTRQYHDFWHVSKSITKKLLAASQEKGNEILKSWMKGIRNHLYWSAISTKQGFGELIIAKWMSIMNHVADQHSDLQILYSKIAPMKKLSLVTGYPKVCLFEFLLHYHNSLQSMCLGVSSSCSLKQRTTTTIPNQI